MKILKIIFFIIGIALVILIVWTKAYLIVSDNYFKEPDKTINLQEPLASLVSGDQLANAKLFFEKKKNTAAKASPLAKTDSLNNRIIIEYDELENDGKEVKTILAYQGVPIINTVNTYHFDKNFNEGKGNGTMSWTEEGMKSFAGYTDSGVKEDNNIIEAVQRSNLSVTPKISYQQALNMALNQGAMPGWKSNNNVYTAQLYILSSNKDVSQNRLVWKINSKDTRYGLSVVAAPPGLIVPTSLGWYVLENYAFIDANSGQLICDTRYRYNSGYDLQPNNTFIRNFLLDYCDESSREKIVR